MTAPILSQFGRKTEKRRGQNVNSFTSQSAFTIMPAAEQSNT
jgi:hypothetical protein